MVITKKQSSYFLPKEFTHWLFSPELTSVHRYIGKIDLQISKRRQLVTVLWPSCDRLATGCERLATGCARLAKIQSRPEPRLEESHMHRKPEISMFLGRPDRARTDAAIKNSVWKIFCAKKSKNFSGNFKKFWKNFKNFEKANLVRFPRPDPVSSRVLILRASGSIAAGSEDEHNQKSLGVGCALL